jgi:hypothetical protein
MTKEVISESDLGVDIGANSSKLTSRLRRNTMCHATKGWNWPTAATVMDQNKVEMETL